MDFIKAYAFKNQWLNFSLYFTNFLYKTKNNTSKNKVCEWITSKDRLKDNLNPIGGTETNNIFLVNGNITNTDFIEVDKTDLITFFKNKDLGFAINKNLLNSPLNYKRSQENNIPNANITNQELDPNNSNIKNNNDIIYFMKGTVINDIINYLINSKII
jgi:hypothetical protein